MTEDQQSNLDYYNCPECQAGHMQLQHIAYFTWLSKELITVPDFPAWVCDVCGRREYDSQAVSWLNILLDTGRSRTTSSTKRKTPPSDQPPAQI